MTAEPRDVDEIRGDIALWAVHPFGAYPTHDQHCARERLLADVDPLLARLAAADRENAELRGEVERHEVFMRAIKDCRDDPARAIAQNDIINGKAIIAAHIAEAERDDLRAQLAAAQAQLAEEIAAHDIDLAEEVTALEAAEARLEAVRALIADARANHEASDIAPFVFADEIAAALSAAPQPEPDDDRGVELCPHCGGSGNATTFDGDDLGACPMCLGTGSAEPPASDEPARCEHGRTAAHYINPDFIGPYALAANLCPGPAASGTPDGGL